MMNTKKPKKGEIISKWDKKVKLLGTLLEALETYTIIIIIETSQATSNIINNIRKKLNSEDKRNTLILGKRSILLLAIDQYSHKNKAILSIKPYLKTGLCGLLFSFSDPQTLCSIIKSECQWESISEGMSCPVDVYMPKGVLPLDPTQTGFFPALNIATKISKGKVEVINTALLVKQGEQVSSSVATLLKLIQMKPIPKVVTIKGIYNMGYIQQPDKLIEQDERIMRRFNQNLRDMESLCIGINYPTKLNFMRTVWQGYTNLYAICMETNYSFDHGQKIVEGIIVNQLRRNGNLNKN